MNRFENPPILSAEHSFLSVVTAYLEKCKLRTQRDIDAEIKKDEEEIA